MIRIEKKRESECEGTSCLLSSGNPARRRTAMLQPISLFPFLKIIIIIISSSILKKTMKLYYFPLSQPSRSVLLLIKEAKIDCEVITVDLMKGEHKKPEYLAVNPLGLVPSIVDDDGFVLCESGAVLTYLAESRSLTEWLPLQIPRFAGG
mmetsp:Transcript_26854/g.38544  ORF Transcript_26854/g.38544 Transcript_26854/m.38544 type:complete len:150 (+) Transcript_26854:1872-2321(+)